MNFNSCEPDCEENCVCFEPNSCLDPHQLSNQVNQLLEKRYIYDKFLKEEETENGLPEFQITPTGIGKYKIKFTEICYIIIIFNITFITFMSLFGVFL